MYVIWPLDPQGPKLEEQGPLKLEVTKFFLLKCKFSMLLTFIWGPNHCNTLTLLGPKITQIYMGATGGPLFTRLSL